jgi:hypothetical protein
MMHCTETICKDSYARSPVLSGWALIGDLEVVDFPVFHIFKQNRIKVLPLTVDPGLAPDAIPINNDRLAFFAGAFRLELAGEPLGLSWPV